VVDDDPAEAYFVRSSRVYRTPVSPPPSIVRSLKRVRFVLEDLCSNLSSRVVLPYFHLALFVLGPSFCPPIEILCWDAVTGAVICNGLPGTVLLPLSTPLFVGSGTFMSFFIPFFFFVILPRRMNTPILPRIWAPTRFRLVDFSSLARVFL